ncbi:hypothetical protein CCACVL1_13248 [Corchorus capsularis]|uniref:Uncharacterized protein n=1 Tax=Corchorus capsularis TaxID=210143 RepID=A0A1R3IBM7_COCAP|nr:hypothetical protein CCACVL1_13248 [Corchorus capsularis]
MQVWAIGQAAKGASARNCSKTLRKRTFGELIPPTAR